MGLNRGLALVGFMGAGKSTVGRVLAGRLGWPFVDTDQVLIRRFGAIAAQLRDGEASFRAREAEVVRELCDESLRVLATGGGAFLDEASRRCLEASYDTVYLAAPLHVLADRVAGAGRPLWDDDVVQRFEVRRPVYETARWVVDTEGRTPGQVADEVMRMVAR